MTAQDVGGSLLQDLPVLIWASDTGGKIIYLNKTWLAFRGRSLDEEAGGKGLKGVHPEDTEECWRQLIIHIKSQKPFSCECRIQRADGTYRWMQNLGNPHFDEMGNYKGFVGSMIDITDRKEAAERLATSQKQLSKAQHLAGVGSWEWDMEKDHVIWSDELYHIFGLEAGAEVDFARYSSYLHPEDREAVQNTVQKAIERKEPYQFDHRIINEKGELRYLHSLGEPILNTSGKPARLIGTAQDITELKNAEAIITEKNEELRQTNKNLEEFAYITSHDLKAPLRAISNLSHWVFDDYRDKLGKEGQEHLKLIMNKAQAMHQLIESILTYSRAGQVEERTQAVGIKDIVEQAIEMLTLPGNITLKVTDSLPVIECEPTKLLQVFSNLISNAIRYNDKPRGIIEIKYNGSDHYHQFTVADNGKGIEPKYHQSIFKMFETLEQENSPDSTGIGLAIVKKIVEHFGGSIHVESEPGIGSQFIFTLKKKAA